MATNKTLAPTNVTIAIPAMSDKPDASVFSNCVDKEADAINALNSNISTCMRKFLIGQVTSSTSFTLSVSSGSIYGLLVGISAASARHILATITLRNNGTAFCTTISNDLVVAQADGNNIVITASNLGAILYLVPFNQDNVDNLVIT